MSRHWVPTNIRNYLKKIVIATNLWLKLNYRRTLIVLYSVILIFSAKLANCQLPDLAKVMTEISSEAWRNAFSGRTWRCFGSWRNVVICPRKMEQTLVMGTVMYRRIVAFVLGDRREATCRKLWGSIPHAYRSCQSYSDFWEAYQLVFSAETHECVGKGSGKTNHMERWYCTLRQICARFVRKTLSFSKSDALHAIVTRLSIIRYNLSLVT